MRHRVIVIAPVLALVLAASALAADPPADLVLHHGRIHTEDPGRSVVQALAVRGRDIAAAGTDAAVDALIGPRTRVVDLGGRVVLPGIIDAHIHPAESAQDEGKCSLEGALLALPAIKARIAECLKTPQDPKLWFEVIQVDPSALVLTRRDLDSFVSDRPMVMESGDGHSAWANSRALAAAGIDGATRDPPGGRIERDAQGSPTGTLRDDAIYLLLDRMPAPGLEAEADKLDRAFEAMRRTGITSVQDASVDDHLMQIYKRLYDRHRLRMRVRASYHLKDLREPAESLIAAAIAFRRKWSIDPDFLRADAVKIFADGVIEYPEQTALLLQPYLDAEGRPTTNRGPAYFDQENLNRIVGAADAAGFTVHVHAIGDGATHAVLDAFAAARRLNGDQDNRDQIAHLELVDPADFPRFRELGVIANFQLQWAERDDYIETATLAYLGPARSRYIYPARSLRDAGALIAGGSDWNVSTFNAFEAMEHAITRAKGRGSEPLLPEQSLTLQNMVDAYTINAAMALRQERTTGSLEPGKRGDFIVLDRDIFMIDPFDLHATTVLATYLDGTEVYAASPR
jgi:predicted amidohydrolase YtcJ